MMSLKSSIGAKKRSGSALSRRSASSGAVALEFAILAIPFFMWVMYIFELSYDLFTQEALDYALNSAVRQIQTGGATSVTSGENFIKQALCPATKGLLVCGNIWLRVSAVTSGSYAPPTTNGAIPVNANGLDLLNYTNLLGANAGSTGSTPYCVAQASQPILVSAVYVGPSFISGLLPGVLSVSFGGNSVHATLSTAGFVTEPVSSGSGGSSKSTAPICGAS